MKIDIGWLLFIFVHFCIQTVIFLLQCKISDSGTATLWIFVLWLFLCSGTFANCITKLKNNCY